MKRAWLIWVVFAASAAGVLGAMGWTIATVLRLRDAETRVRSEAALEENVRLALWRMDSSLGAFLVAESARPPFVYQPFYSAGGSTNGASGRTAAEGVIVPSPLLTEDNPFVRIHFQLGPDGALTSPQAPEGKFRKTALDHNLPLERVAQAETLLRDLREKVALPEVLAAVPEQWLLEEKPEAGPDRASAGAVAGGRQSGGGTGAVRETAQKPVSGAASAPKPAVVAQTRPPRQAETGPENRPEPVPAIPAGASPADPGPPPKTGASGGAPERRESASTTPSAGPPPDGTPVANAAPGPPAASNQPPAEPRAGAITPQDVSPSPEAGAARNTAPVQNVAVVRNVANTRNAAPARNTVTGQNAAPPRNAAARQAVAPASNATPRQSPMPAQNVLTPQNAAPWPVSALQRKTPETRDNPQGQQAAPARPEEANAPPAVPPPTGSAPPRQSVEVQQAESPGIFQQTRNVQEWVARENLGISNDYVVQNIAIPSNFKAPRGRAGTRPDGRPAPTAGHPKAAVEAVKVGVLKPLWTRGELLLARRVRIGERAWLQGCWVDWPKVRPWLLAQVRDLLPEAELVPQEGPANPAEGRTLASIPVRVRPGRVALTLPDDGSPLLFSLKLAGAGALAAVLAVGLLLMGALTLSRRRAAFVSSVTHELRTPLTTFRMYTEMLTDGMATDPDRLADYHQVLRTEADRLSHLVENVLAYARLERGRYGVAEEVAFSETLERIVPRLREHAEQAGMELVREPGGEDGTRVRVDAGAVERILFNLVDNAGKYAREASDRRIHLATRREGRWMVVTVRDHGPGVRSHRRGLFRRAFRKSAGEAARTAPGVGIGLALSRRLARAMGGRLRLAASSAEGAEFRLDLPVARGSKHEDEKAQGRIGGGVE